MADGLSSGDSKLRGRPRLHVDLKAAQRAANRATAARAAAAGITQRSVWLPAVLWKVLRQARTDGETSDAQTLARLIGCTAAP